MKNYLSFYWDNYYPEGGMNDFIDSFDTINEAIISIEHVRKKKCESIHNSPSGSSGVVWSTKDKKEVYNKRF